METKANDGADAERAIVAHYTELVPDLDQIRVTVLRRGEVVRFVLLEPDRAPTTLVTPRV